MAPWGEDLQFLFRLKNDAIILIGKILPKLWTETGRGVRRVALRACAPGRPAQALRLLHPQDPPPLLPS